MSRYLRTPLLGALGSALILSAWVSAQTVPPQAQSATPLPPPAVLSSASLEQQQSNAAARYSRQRRTDDLRVQFHLERHPARDPQPDGGDLDIPPQADERVVARLGPGPAREVVRSLLAGSRFDYVIVGSDTDPNAVVKLLLFPKRATENAPPPVVNTADASTIVTEGVEQEDNPQEPVLPVRAQQQMVQQRRQMIMEELQRSRQPE